MEKLLKEVQNLYIEAELQIKVTEYTSQELVVPAVNQLRYAGNHLVRYENAENDKDRMAELQLAKNHCKRSIYDAIEAKALYLLLEFKKFGDDYRNIAIGDIVPTYSKVLEKVDNLAELISSETIKEENVKNITDFTNDLDVEFKKLEANKHLLNRKISNERHKLFIAIIISVLCLTLSVIIASNVIFFPKKDLELDNSSIEKINELNNIQSSLKSLSEYINTQKDMLSNINSTVKSLKIEKNNLDTIIKTKQDAVDAIIKTYVKESSSEKTKEIIISFITGAFASLVASLLISYFRQKRLENNVK